MGLMSRNKGKTGERELCALLRESLGNIAAFERNSMQSHGEARTGMQWDILTNLPIALEVKRTEDVNPKKWLEQARRQAKGDRLPVVAHRSNGEPWKFLFELTPREFCRVMRAVHMFNKLPPEVQERMLRGPAIAGSDHLIGGPNATD